MCLTYIRFPRAKMIINDILYNIAFIYVDLRMKNLDSITQDWQMDIYLKKF